MAEQDTRTNTEKYEQRRQEREQTRNQERALIRIISSERDRDSLLAVERYKLHEFLSRKISYCAGDDGQFELEYKNEGEVDDLKDLVETLQRGEQVDYWYLVQLANYYAAARWNSTRRQDLKDERKRHKAEVAGLKHELDLDAKRENARQEAAQAREKEHREEIERVIENERKRTTLEQAREREHEHAAERAIEQARAHESER